MENVPKPPSVCFLTYDCFPDDLPLSFLLDFGGMF